MNFLQYIFCLFIFSIGFVYSQDQKNITFLDNWSDESLLTNSSLVRYSGCYGFTREGTEYAIIGSTEGTHFFQLSSDNRLIPCGYIEGRFKSSMVIHREFKTYKNYAYSICDEGTSSLQIIDLSYLPDSVVKVADFQDENFGKVHNIFIDTANALLYACLVTPIIDGNMQSMIPLRVFSLANPVNPTLIWEGPSDINEVHDCYVRDNIAIMNCGPDGLRVYDFSNSNTPNYISNLTIYQDQGYNHQGWLSPNGKTYIFADETTGKRLKKCEVNSNFDIKITQYFGTNYLNNSIPHNIMCTNEFAFIAYYNEGLRIFDIRDIPKEIACYDTYTGSNFFNMNGAWGVFSNYSSGRIIISDRQSGLFLFHFDQALFLNEASDDFSVYPNPAIKGQIITIRSAEDKISDFSVKVFNASADLILETAVSTKSFCKIEAPAVSGLFTLQIKYTNYLGEEISVIRKIIVQ
jgi:choice-of-anchor B domain-containing protein